MTDPDNRLMRRSDVHDSRRANSGQATRDAEGVQVVPATAPSANISDTACFAATILIAEETVGLSQTAFAATGLASGPAVVEL